MKQGLVLKRHHVAMINFNFIAFKTCIQNGAISVDATSEYGTGERPIHYVVTSRNNQKLVVLLDCGANPNVQNRAGNTPLHYAASCDSAEAILILLRYGANLKLKNNDQLTPAMVAHIKVKGSCAANMLLDYEKRIDSAKASVCAFIVCCKRTRRLHKDFVVAVAKQIWNMKLDPAWASKK